MIIVLAYVDGAFERLTKKIQSSERFKNFRNFWVFVLRYRANSKRWKRRKIQKTFFLQQINYWDAVFINNNLSSSFGITKNVKLVRYFISRKQLKLCSKLVERYQFTLAILEFRVLISFRMLTFLGNEIKNFQKVEYGQKSFQQLKKYKVKWHNM